MDGHGPGPGAGKLTRTPSSLLRSPTVSNCSSLQAVLLEDPEPDHKKAQAVAALQAKDLHHPHGLRPTATHPVLVLLALPLALLLLILFAVGRVVREGVEFYSNGDCYEGEFHKGRCNGAGVYNFFGKRK
ncbi:hypothetical protein QYE76_015148 [Lolium multiflorum]|uniref:Uncharacterized protein n=1 Tax=Lolium multiflorum TaxID=4521 RepID=A0AAD8U214_LOLMU|nr:hypothetical protein QYE76_015148 [Lolium multiflorum]